jgi:transposase
MRIMPKSTKEEKFRWIKPILDREITIRNMAKVCPFSERSLKYWLAEFRKNGMDGLENKSRRPKSNPKETPIRIKERIIELRKETKKCALKLKWQMEKEGIIDVKYAPESVGNKQYYQFTAIDLEHCGLNGLSPNEFLRLSEAQNVCD